MAFLKKHLERSAYVPYFAYNQLADPGSLQNWGFSAREPFRFGFQNIGWYLMCWKMCISGLRSGRG